MRVNTRYTVLLLVPLFFFVTAVGFAYYAGAVIPVLSSTLLLGFTGQNFLTTTASSATSHLL